MAARRPYWKGYLKLSLVTCPVALYPASSQSEKTHFHQINRETGHRLRQQMVDEVTGEPVDKDQKARGYELPSGKYVEIEPEDLEAIEVESITRSISKSSYLKRRSRSAITSGPITWCRMARAARTLLLSSATP